MNYIHTDVLNHAVKTMAAIEGAGELIRCLWQHEPGTRLCLEPATYLVAGSTRVSAGGDIESGPQWFCRKHLELTLGGPPEEQPIFGRIIGE